MIKYGNCEKKDDYNNKYFHDGSLYKIRPKERAIQTFCLSNGTLVGIFQGKRGSHPDLDFVVRILLGGQEEKMEPPIHTYWVVDLMIKSHYYKNEVRDILDYYIDFYNKCTPFSSQKEREVYKPQTVSHIMGKYGTLDVSKTLPVDYIALIIELFCLNEKRNKDAYMFKNLLLILKDYVDGKSNYMAVIKASMPLNRYRKKQ